MSAPPDDPREHERVVKQRAALLERRRFRRSAEGELATAYQTAMKLGDQMREDGATPAQIQAVLEGAIRATWPKGREAEWRDLCAECSDYGLRILNCPGDATCGRTRPHYAHDYGVPCWCPKGRRFTPKQKTVEDELTQVGKVGKPTRFGR